MSADLKARRLVKLARILCKDPDIGCASLAALSEEYSGPEVVDLLLQFRREADPDAREMDTALDFVLEILGGN